jgi:predicted O-methyltransferase YrrM
MPKSLVTLLSSTSWPFSSRYASFKLRHSFKQDLDGYVDLAYNAFATFPFIGYNIMPSQVREELVELLGVVAKLKPQTVLEIGTARGGTFYLFTRVSDPEATLISVDLPKGFFGGGYPESKLSYYNSFGLRDQKVWLVRNDSHSSFARWIVRNALGGNDLDFLFIDGDHTYNGVKQDFQMYSPLVRRGGLIALHDVCPHCANGDEVYRFWNELKKDRDTQEIIRDRNQGWAGIGIVYT